MQKTLALVPGLGIFVKSRLFLVGTTRADHCGALTNPCQSLWRTNPARDRKRGVPEATNCTYLLEAHLT